MPDTDTEKLTVEAAIAKLADKYELVYVAYDDKLSDEQVEKVVSGDLEGFWEATSEFESESRWHGSEYVIKDVFTDDEWDSLEPDEQEEVRDAIYERDESAWDTELMSHTSNPLLRINAISEDDSFSHREVCAGDILDHIGFDATEHNIKIINNTLAECSTDVMMGYWVLSADLATLYKSNEGDKLRFTNPHLFLGNPFTGAGWVTEEALHGTIDIDREDVHTDKEAFGYGINEIYGGVYASEYESEVAIVTEEQLQAELEQAKTEAKQLRLDLQ